MRSHSLPFGLVLACASLVAGCDALEPDDSLLYVFSTHHATPEEGTFPDRGGDDMPRVFDNGDGWTVTLLESYITIRDITVLACDGTAYPLEMFWGPCPEDLRSEDLDILTVAGRKLPEGHYCTLVVDYGPYETPEMDPAEEEPEEDTLHDAPENEAVDGSTVYLNGGAISETTDPIEFELRTTSTVTVELDLSEIENGAPLYIGHHDAFPAELTVSKTYDRFLDGVDFTAFDENAVEDDLEDRLRDATRVQEGTEVQMFDPE